MVVCNERDWLINCTAWSFNTRIYKIKLMFCTHSDIEVFRSHAFFQLPLEYFDAIIQKNFFDKLSLRCVLLYSLHYTSRSCFNFMWISCASRSDTWLWPQQQLTRQTKQLTSWITSDLKRSENAIIWVIFAPRASFPMVIKVICHGKVQFGMRNFSVDLNVTKHHHMQNDISLFCCVHSFLVSTGFVSSATCNSPP